MIKPIGISSLLCGILVASCTGYTGRFEVIELTKQNYNPCPVHFAGRDLVIDNAYVYSNGKLVQHSGCGSEGLYTLDFDKDVDYSTEERQLKYLSVSRRGNTIDYAGHSYKAIAQAGDSLLVTRNSEILLFVGRIPDQ